MMSKAEDVATRSLCYRNGLRTGSLLYGEDGVALDDPTEVYHEASKYRPSMALAQAGPLGYDSPLALETEDRLGRPVRRGPGPAVDLPAATPLRMPLGETLLARWSCRDLADGPVPLPDLAAILWAAYGVRRARRPDDPVTFRTVPSAGGRYPLNVLCVPRLVPGLPGGPYHYDPFASELVRWSTGPAGSGRGAQAWRALSNCTSFPDVVGAAAVTLVLVSSFWRSRSKYGQRAYRFTLMEAGHVAQNAVLAAAALGLSSVPLGGFFDDRLDTWLGIDGVTESAVYLVALGHPR